MLDIIPPATGRCVAVRAAIGSMKILRITRLEASFVLQYGDMNQDRRMDAHDDRPQSDADGTFPRYTQDGLIVPYITLWSGERG